MVRHALVVAALAAAAATGSNAQQPVAPRPAAGTVSALPAIPGAKPRSIVFILTDDHRYDALGFLRTPAWLETPHLDALARNGVHARNAFVTTALCSPSRASILTGRYAHRHRVVDNVTPVPPGTVFFPQYLQRAGYDTAFIGKWHMGGESDEPKPGFDRWVSFRGQGTYLPTPAGLNVDGRSVPRKGYITDELTDYATEWLSQRPAGKPYFLYLSHKGVHSEFVPAERHRGSYAGKPVPVPATMADTAANYADKPMWLKNQRNSWHGVDFPYHSSLDIAEYYRRYMETLRGVDDSVGRVVELLRKRGELDSTLIVYMGDNGFMFGEHGLIDKRTAYEASMRVPMLLQCPELFKGGTRLDRVVANIDIMPTFLDAAGVRAPEGLDGLSILGAAQGRDLAWRDALLYEYYWERNFPHTPTMHAVRGDRYKYIRYYGLWDVDELYDLQADPDETTNLIRRPELQDRVKQMNTQLFDLLERTDGMYIPLNRDRGGASNLRRGTGSKPADFPREIIAPPK